MALSGTDLTDTPGSMSPQISFNSSQGDNEEDRLILTGDMVGGIQMQRYNFHVQHSVVTVTYRNRGKKLEESERSNNKQMVILITLLDQYK